MLQVATYSRISKPCGSDRLSAPSQQGQAEQAHPTDSPREAFYLCGVQPHSQDCGVSQGTKEAVALQQ